MSGPLLTGYRFLSLRGHLPEAPESPGVLTIVLNSFMMTTGLLWFGLIFSFVFVSLAGREDRLWKNIVKVVLLALFGASCLANTQDKYFQVAGVLLLVALFCVITPLSKWIDRHTLAAMGVFGILLIASILLQPDWMKDWWTLSFQREDFSLVPVSEMNWAEWVVAVMGAAVYVLAYGAFQQWRTDGKWLDETKNRLKGNA
jgi:hypothetical protein